MGEVEERKLPLVGGNRTWLGPSRCEAGVHTIALFRHGRNGLELVHERARLDGKICTHRVKTAMVRHEKVSRSTSVVVGLSGAGFLSRRFKEEKSPYSNSICKKRLNSSIY